MAKKKVKAKVITARPAEYARFYLRVSESPASPAQLPELMVRQVLDRGV